MLYLDSADPADVREADRLGFLSGVTTNPTLMRPHTRDALAHLELLLGLLRSGTVLFQPTSGDVAEAERQARAAHGLAPERVVVKLPATIEHARLAAVMVRDGIPCAMTAVYSPGQALLAHASGCAWVIPYVNRMWQDPRADPDALARIATVLRAAVSPIRILAASVKSAGQVAWSLHAGAHAVSVPLAVLRELGSHPATDDAIAAFEWETTALAGH